MLKFVLSGTFYGERFVNAVAQEVFGLLDTHEQLVDLLQAVNRRLNEQVKSALGELGLPLIGMGVMHQIHAQPGITVSDLARRTGLAKSHVSTTVEGLARKGLLEKRPDPADQRLIRIYTTTSADTGRRRFQDQFRRRLAEMLRGLPEERAAALIDSLQTLKAVLEQKKEV